MNQTSLSSYKISTFPLIHLEYDSYRYLFNEKQKEHLSCKHLTISLSNAWQMLLMDVGSVQKLGITVTCAARYQLILKPHLLRFRLKIPPIFTYLKHSSRTEI